MDGNLRMTFRYKMDYFIKVCDWIFSVLSANRRRKKYALCVEGEI